MQKAEITPGQEYALRETRASSSPFQRVRVLQHVRGTKWKAEWIEPNLGLVDYVESATKQPTTGLVRRTSGTTTATTTAWVIMRMLRRNIDTSTV